MADSVLLALAVLLEGALVAMVARRVLGAPVGWPRALMVGLLTILGLGPSINFIVDTTGFEVGKAIATPLAALPFIVLGMAWAFVLGVTSLVVLEAIAPTGTLPTPITVIAAWRARRRRTRRYAQVMAIAVRHGLGGYLRGRTRRGQSAATLARSLRDALNEGGVTFVKLGQMISTRRDLVPEEFVRQLSTLQTRAEPEPWSRIEPAVAAGLGRPIGDVFSAIDPRPLASASVAQVHRARLRSGQDVVVKVQRPGARDQVTADLEIISRLAVRLERLTSWGRSLGVVRLARGFAASLEEELDYTVELDNMRGIAGGGIAVPRAHEAYCGPTLLVMDVLDGMPVGDAGPLLATFPPETRKKIADRLLNEVLHQILVTGVFHADLHPGNIFITDVGELGMLDFGSVGRLDGAARTSLGLLLLSIDRNDSVAATDALIELLDRPRGLAERELERDIGQLMLRYRPGLGNGGSAGMFTTLFKLVSGHEFAIPPQVAAAFRAFGALEGTLEVISEDVDLVEAARRQGRELMAHATEPEAIRADLESRLVHFLPTLQRLPRRIGKITEDLEQGRFTVHVRPFADQEDRRFLTGLIQQVIVAILAGAAMLGAIILMTSDTGPMITPTFRLFTFLGCVLLLVGFVLALRSLVLVFTRRSD